jgi:glycosyltransferase involved in cell wall biosynthesis
MLMKRLVVSTYISDIPNVIKHEKTGYLFHEKSHEDLIEILKFIINNFKETLPIVEDAYELAVKKFDRNQNYAELKKVLISCISNQR